MTMAEHRAAGEELIALCAEICNGAAPRLGDLAQARLLAPMRGAPHDPVHHAEGDPLVHTQMVVEALLALEGFCALQANEREVLVLAALLHDCAKPQTAVVVDGRVSHPSHAPRGARKARAVLYAAGFDPSLREAVASLCRRHMQPHHALASRADDTALLRWLATASTEVPVHLLLLLAEADAKGRIAERPDDSAALLREFAQEHDVLNRAWPFADETARLECCRDRDRDPRFATGTPQQSPTVTILSGLPATGKSTIAMALNAQRISIEDMMDGGMERGRALQAGREQLRQALRERRDAVWDATMLTRTLRRQLVGLAEDYGARCVIRACELPQAERTARNAERANPVPDTVVAGMLTTWEMPTFDEALVIEGRPARLEPVTP